MPPGRTICVSSALLARLWAGLGGVVEPAASTLPFGVGCEDVAVCGIPPEVERCVGVVEPVGTLFDDSVLPAPRR